MGTQRAFDVLMAKDIRWQASLLAKLHMTLQILIQLGDVPQNLPRLADMARDVETSAGELRALCGKAVE